MSSASNQEWTDFYRHVNGKWLDDESIQIPKEYPRWGSFIILADESLKNQIGLLKEICNKKDANDDEKKLACLWNASMKRFQDWEEGKGDYEELFKEFQVMERELDGEDYVGGLASYLGRSQELGIGSPIVFDKEANLLDSENVVLDIGSSGLNLPNRDYYLEERLSKQFGWFKDHLEKVVDIIGSDKLQDNFVQRILRFEMKLAQLSMKPEQRRKYDQYFTVTTLDEVCSQVNELNYLKEKDENYSSHKNEDHDQDVCCTPEYQATDEDKKVMEKMFTVMIEKLGLRETLVANYKKNYPEDSSTDAHFRCMIFDGDFFKRIFKILSNESNKDDIKAYLQYKIIRFGSNYTTKVLNEEFFDFYSRKLVGQEEQKPIEKRTVRLINNWMSEVLGRVYVSRFFLESDKERIETMIKEVLQIMDAALDKNDWLTEKTKQKAKQKLEAFSYNIGYPTKWKDYSELTFSLDDSLFKMHAKINAFDHQTEFLDKVNDKVDKTKWEMAPQTVNAYFHPLKNAIYFPAAILQPPFYHRDISQITFDLGPDIPLDTPHLLEAINFGGCGAVIAHEITHGFDDQGRKFDSKGNVKDWWEEGDAKLFKEKCDLMTEQVEQYEFKDEENGVHNMKADLTMGENLADLGGMSLACKALVKQLGPKATKPVIKAFFMSWANIWKSKQTTAFTLNCLSTDPHAPPDFRANLAKNIDTFYEAFDIKEDHPMYLQQDKRVQMW